MGLQSAPSYKDVRVPKTFTEFLPHPEGEIGIHFVGELGGPEYLGLLFSLASGSRYTPIRHRHAHTLIVMAGSGYIQVGTKKILYKPRSRFFTKGEELHGFVDVKEHTVVLEIVHYPGRAPCRR